MSEPSTLLTVVGTPGDDFLIGTNGNDLLDGGDGFDHLLGLAGDDTLIGGTGNDQLDGGSGNDTYVFAIGDGFDAIREGALSPDAGGVDTVRLLAGYDPATTEVYRYGNDLVIRSPAGDEIYVQEHFGSYLDGSLRSAIEQIVFADGTVWDAAAIVNRVASNNSNLPTEGNDTIGGTPWGDYIDGMGGNDTLSGGDGDDFLIGGFGNDRLFGGAGNDFVGGKDGDDVLAGGAGVDNLEGGAGNDTYLFNAGDGQDRISDFPVLGETNRVVFGDGIAFADLHAYADYGVGGVVIDVGTGGDRLELSGEVLDPYAGLRVIDSFRFADGTAATADAVFGYGSYQQGGEFDDWLAGTGHADSLYGNGGNDWLYGDSGNDILAGGQGFDRLSGGAGNDTYAFNRGDGVDYIDDYAFAPFEGNRVLFGEGISIDDLRLRIDVAVPILEIAGMPGDGLQFSSLDPFDPTAPRSVETFEFADGTTLSYDQLIARGFYVGGTEWDDYLIGSPYSDRIYGYGGDDWLQGMAGNDTLIGGTGYDQLDGGSGNDTYMFTAGDGFDMIWEGSGTPEVGGTDTVKLLDGYDPATTELYRYETDLAIRNSVTGDQVMVRDHFGSYVDGSRRAAIEQIAFADGTVWDATAINARIASGNSNWTSEGNDAVGGTPGDDFIFGLAGNDTLSGDAGNDILDGGVGNDRLFGGAGDDRLWDMYGNGNDLLAGGTGNDFLSGGGGDDTYWFNLGDGVDRIEEMPVPGETNRVVFGEGIGFTDLRANYDWGTGETVIDVGSGGDQLRLAGTYPDPYGLRAIDTFTFADGTVASFDALFGYAIYFTGSQVDDWISGTVGADGLYGNGGNDSLDGHDGDDFIGGGQGDDWLSGGAGNDTYLFNLGDGFDTIDDIAAPGETNRVLFGAGITLDNLRLRFDGPESILQVGTGWDVIRIIGFSPIDPLMQYPVGTFEFADGTMITADELIARGFHVDGSDWGDYLTGSEYNDRIFGLDGDDQLFGLSGNDTLVGGSGFDQLDGGSGNDTYFFAVGDGSDLIWEGSGTPDAGGTDTVKLGFGIDPAATELYRFGNDLSIRFMAGGEILVREHFGSYEDGNTRGAIEQIVFADGTIWGTEAIANRVSSMNSNQITEGGDTVVGGDWNDYLSGMGGNDTLSGGWGDDTLEGDSGNDRLFGNQDNDVLYGGDGNDVLAGGTGNDWLSGGIGNDTYLFNLGDGIDSIDDSLMDDEHNQVVFGEGIRFQDLHASYDFVSGEMRIDVGNDGDQLRVAGASLDPYGPSPVDTFRFADGTVATFDALTGYGVYRQGDSWLPSTPYADGLYGGRGDDVLFGDGGDDYLGGGQGNDWLGGGQGDDTYLFNIGDGVDFIEDYANPGEGNRVLFGAGIGLDDLRLRFDGWQAYLEIGTNGDTINFSAFNPLDPFVPHSVDVFEFADGTALSYAELVARGFHVGGSEWSDYLIGSPLNDRLYGYGGDDTLTGMEGADTLVGGTGNDQLYGGAGSDVYEFRAGDGFDTVWDGAGMPYDDVGFTDVVMLQGGYDPATTQLQRWGSDLVIANAQSGDQIVVREHFGSDYDGNTRSAIEQITFADGTIWDAAAIANRLAAFNDNMPTEGNDTIAGTPWSDYMYAMGGDDTVSGGQGDDQIFGGAGNDRLFGGPDNDFLAGEDGDDLLAGGSGSDVLAGGMGNDRYVFNLGDGVDRIEELAVPGESNRVVFGAGIGYQDLTGRVDFSFGEVVIDVGNAGDQLRLAGTTPYPYGPQAVDLFQFADGTVATFDAVMGNGSYVLGGDSGDWLNGTIYADSIYGNAGDDVMFGADGNDILSGGAGSDQLIGDSGDDVLSGGDGDDLLFGHYGNDDLSGGTGNDVLEGGYGDDTYRFNRGDGVDTIVDVPEAEPVNRVVFGPGINMSDLRLSRQDGELRISVAGADAPPGSEDMLIIAGFNPYDGAERAVIRTFEFADGTQVSFAELLGLGFDITGTEGDDYLAGTAVEDRMAGLGGNDRLVGMDGNDYLDGGAGYDELFGGAGDDVLIGGTDGNDLYGGAGSDSYHVGVEGGWSRIDERRDADFMPGSPDDVDRVYFDPSIAAADLIVTRTGYNDEDLWIEVASTDPAYPWPRPVATISGWFDPAYSAKIEEFVFADGTVLSTSEIEALANRAPVVTNPIPDFTALEDESFTLPIYPGTFIDPDAGDSLTYSATLADGSPLPGWVSFDPVTMTFGGTPGNAEVGGYAIRITATDSYGAQASTDFTLAVHNTNDAPMAVGTIADQSVPEDQLFSLTVDAGLFADDDAIHGDVLTLSASLADGSPLPSWLGFDPASGTFSGTPANGDVGSLSLRVTATDASGLSAIRDFALVISNVNDAPVVPAKTATLVEDWGLLYVSGALLAGAYDIDPTHDALSIAAVGNAQHGTVSLDEFGKTLFIPDANYNGAASFDFTVSDGNGGLTTSTVTISVLPDNDAPTLATPIADQLASEDVPFIFQVPASTFSEVDAGDSLSYLATLADGSPLPPWLVFDAATRSFSGTPANGDVGALALRVLATDTAGASAVADFMLTVANVNDAPVAGATLADQAVNEDSPFQFSVPADAFSDFDIVHGDSLTLSATLTNGSPLPAWLSFDAATATFSGIPENGDVGSVTVLITATDSAGATATSGFTLTVANTNDAPVLVSAVADQAAAEGEVFSYQIAADAFGDVDAGDVLTYSATLADGSALPTWLSFDAATRSVSGNPADGDAGDYAIKVTATDSAGASVSDEFVVSVADAIATVHTGTAGVDTLQGTAFRDVLSGLGSNDILYGYAGDDLLDGGSGSDTMRGGTGNDTYVVGGTGDVVVENADEGIDTVQSSISYTLGANVENLTLTGTSNRNGTGNSLDNVLTGNSGANTLTGNAGNDTLDGGAGTDSLRGGTGNDTYVFTRGYGADTIVENDATAGNTDTVAMGVNALDVVFARSGSNLLMTLHGGTDKLTVSNWYSGSQYQTEVIETADGQQLLNTQVDQLIQAMAQFSASSGLTWDQALDQRPEDIQAIVSAYWQPVA